MKIKIIYKRAGKTYLHRETIQLSCSAYQLTDF